MGGRGVDCVLEKVFNPAWDWMRGRRTPDTASRPKHTISGVLIRKSAVELSTQRSTCSSLLPRYIFLFAAQRSSSICAPCFSGARQDSQGRNNHHRLSAAIISHSSVILVGPQLQWPSASLVFPALCELEPQRLSIQFEPAGSTPPPSGAQVLSRANPKVRQGPSSRSAS